MAILRQAGVIVANVAYENLDRFFEITNTVLADYDAPELTPEEQNTESLQTQSSNAQNGDVPVYDAALGYYIPQTIAAGTQGPQGDTGPQGPIGLTGAQGIAGTNGSDGANGLDGAQGLQGIPGIQGPAGNDGATGAQGIQGIAGNDGAQGPIGLTGPQGDAGANGSNGSNGSDGQSAFDGAVAAGYTGTESEFYAALANPPPPITAIWIDIT